MVNPTGSDNSSEEESWKAQQDYAWEWFKYHAKQRTDMFNYFLITTGLLTAGYANLRKDGHFGLSWVIAVLGMVSTFGFYNLDRRNKQIIEKSVDILEIIEEKKLFVNDAFKSFGLTQRRYDRPSLMTRHTFVFQSIQISIALMWTGAFLAAIRYEVQPLVWSIVWLIFIIIWIAIGLRILALWLNPKSNSKGNKLNTDADKLPVRIGQRLSDCLRDILSPSRKYK